MNYDLLKQSLPYRALLGLGAPLTGEDFEQIQRDAKLYCALWMVNRAAVEKAYGQDAAALHAKSSTEQALGKECYHVMVKPDALSAEDLPAIESDDTTLIAAVLVKEQNVFRLLGEKYALPSPLVQYLMEQDLKAIVGVLSGGGAASRFETYRERAVNRLTVHRKNHRAIEGITKEHGIRRHAFFDVGCLFGLSMVSAQSLGYARTHGCELDRKVFGRARWITEWMRSNQPGDFAYYDKDFTSLELPAREYTLVMINNVLEHTPDLDATVAQLGRVLADDGVAYLYQGNHKSLQFVRTEPHYRLPLLTILPRDLVVEILMRMKRINKPEDYVVTRWPGYEELGALFSKYALRATFHAETLGYWGAAAPVQPSQFGSIRDAIWTEAKEKVFGVLTLAEQQRVEEIGMAYFREVEEFLSRNPAEAKIRYLKPTWDITAVRPGLPRET